MLKRILTAIVLIVFIAAVLLWAPIWLFKMLILVLIAGALYEFYRLSIPGDTFSLITGLVFGLIVAAFMVFVGVKVWMIAMIVFLFFILTLAHMFYFTAVEGVVARLGLILFGSAYISLTLPSFVWLRVSDHGRSLIVFTIAIVALGDSFAYSAGKMFGRRKLAPLISPNKTWEGFIASFFGGVLASLICWQIFWRELPIALIIFLGISVALIGALGDLVESLIKRAHHVKDSGTLLPGHGGVLDRVDALVFAAPFVYFTFKFLGWI